MLARIHFYRCLAAALAALLGLVLQPTFVDAVAAVEVSPAELVGDAELTDVYFLDQQLGWAVGDRGVVWHTQDAGRHWRLQPTGVATRLESVWFVNPERGWAVGGETHPFTHTSQAVILRTLDGGKTWNPVPGLLLPALRQVRFFDPRNGWAAGGSSSMYPTGVFRTSDAGRTWIPMTRGPSAHWRCADFASPLGGAAAAADGSLATAHEFELAPARAPTLGLRRATCLRLDAAGNGWLVGEGGLVFKTTDGGRSWQEPPAPLPAAAGACDLGAAAMLGSHVWIAGTPGTLMFHSADGGRTWETLNTSQRLPIHAVTFVNEQTGWAVGALGTILATVDGGRTWRVQRSGGERVALLGLLLDPSRAPLELLAELADNQGYLTAVELLARRDLQGPAAAGELLEHRSREALASVGVSSTSTAWSFPLRQQGLEAPLDQVTAAWNRCNAGDGFARLEQRLTAHIRMWRPDVVLTEPANPIDDAELRKTINRIVLSAVEKAADDSAYPWQLSELGLEVWTVKKVFGHADPGESADIELVTAQLAPALGRSLADHASAARGLIFDHYVPEPESVGVRLVHSRLSAGGRRDVFSGIMLPPGGEARRPPRAASTTDARVLQNLALRRRTVSRLLEYGAKSQHGGAAWLAQLDDLTRGLSPTAAGDVLYQMASRFHQSGRGELAAQVHQALVERHSEHPLAEASLVWLVHYYASGEAAWRLRRETTIDGGAAAAQIDGAAEVELDGQQPPARATPQGASFHFDQRQSSTVEMDGQSRAQAAVKWGKLLEGSRPALYAEASVRFPLAVAQRGAGLPRQSDQWLQQLGGAYRRDAWTACGEAEQWLAQPGDRLPAKSLVRCATAGEKPKLDGRFDDAVWRNAQPLDLASPLGDDGAWPAAVLLAHDDEFLYLAVSCGKAAGAEYTAAEGPRRHDADLAGQDRIDLLIDIDRDYATYYRLSIDHRGRVSESCLDDPTWNPQAFIFAESDETSWRIEAAIPLEELAPPGDGAQRAWAIGLQRTVPGVGFQSWTQPAAVNIRPEGFGLLMLR
ncbi:MAG: YCF48-related protein [Pirellulaceae bacterium]